MLTQNRACHLFIHHHAFKAPPIYEHPDQQSLQEYPPIAASSNFDLSIPGSAADAVCKFVFDTWIRIEADLSAGETLRLTLANSTVVFWKLEVTSAFHYMGLEYNAGEVKEEIETAFPRKQWVGLLFSRGCGVGDNVALLAVNDTYVD